MSDEEDVAMIGCGCVFLIAKLTVIGFFAWVAWHFIMKWW